ncbi:MAG: hypothetical protein LDL31_04425 [Prosthecobacter sp.]|jgi:hypothetical protein|nr:hypothetical protein [Prosthecobacter sp.]
MAGKERTLSKIGGVKGNLGMSEVNFSLNRLGWVRFSLCVNLKSLVQSMLAMLMAVPLHLCCWTGMMQAAGAEEACMGCHQFLEPGEVPPLHSESQPDRHCACCEDTLLRQPLPSSVSAPKVKLLELPVTAWPVTWDGAWHEVMRWISAYGFPNAHAPPMAEAVPLFQRHCALLL